MRQSLAEWIRQRAGIQRRSDTNLSQLHTSDNELDHYVDRVKQLFGIAKQQAFEIASERKKRRRVEDELSKSRERLKRSYRERQLYKRALRRASRELNYPRRQEQDIVSHQLRQQIKRSEQNHQKEISKERLKRTQAEENLKKAKTELGQLQQKYKDQSNKLERIVNEQLPNTKSIEERDRRRIAEKEAKNLKIKLRHTRRSLNTMRRDHSKCGKHSTPILPKSIPYSDKLLGLILPKLKLADESNSRLRESQSVKRIFDDLHRLNNFPQSMRGERVASAEPWLEIRPTKTKRIYYKRTKNNGAYLVLIGDKHTQSRDIEWLKKNR